MFGEEKKLKDPERTPPASYGADSQNMSVIISYTKTNKLITALYMVTDVIDKDEPLRNKLRTLGAEIISDMHSAPANACAKISEIMSFLDIASAINIISNMNCSILVKEFLELNQSIVESTDKVETLNRRINLSEFFRDETPPKQSISIEKYGSIGHSIGHQHSTRIGVQKGSTLMKALSDKTHFMSNKNSASVLSANKAGGENNFDILKQKRRADIIGIIKIIGGRATITNIKDKVLAAPEQAGLLVACSEKTLQRELMSMIKDGVLTKTGEKRWSRYFLV